jgi:fluoride exporter
MKQLLMVGLGGMFGSMLRYLIGIWIKQQPFPYATFSVNIMGSFIIGLVMGWASKEADPTVWKLILVTGFCGGFTTFSAFAWENFQFLQEQSYLQFILYAGGSIVICLAAVAFGYHLTK